MVVNLFLLYCMLRGVKSKPLSKWSTLSRFYDAEPLMSRSTVPAKMSDNQMLEVEKASDDVIISRWLFQHIG